jgi:hypothetical protein
MNLKRRGTRGFSLLALAAVGLLEAIYLAAGFWKSVSALRAIRDHWEPELARQAGPMGVVWLALVAGCVALAAAIFTRKVSLAMLLAVAILIGCLGLESSAMVERLKYKRMATSISNLLRAEQKLLADSTSSTLELPSSLSPALVADGVFHDGWGHPLRYIRTSPNHAFLIAPGSDGRIEAHSDTVEGNAFPASSFGHDIIVEISGRDSSLIVYPNAPSQGIPCTIYTAFGCLSYWR